MARTQCAGMAIVGGADRPQGCTRRTFAGTSACLAAAAAAGALAAPVSEARAEAPDAPLSDFDREESFDIVVVGSGTAGTCAAVRAAELGASTLCLEKTGILGGTSTMTEYMTGVNNPIALKNGVEQDPDEVYRQFMDYGDWGPRGDVVRAYVDHSGETVQWLMDAGCSFDFMGFGPALTGNVDGVYAHNGQTVLEPLRVHAVAAGNVEFRTDCPAIELVVEDGAVRGVYARAKDGAVSKIAAKAVVLATGGFSGSREYYEKLVGSAYDEITFFGLPGRDGDALRMTEALNPRIHAPASLAYTFGCVEGTRLFDDDLNVCFAWNPLLSVDGQGLRFMSENLVVGEDNSLRNIALATVRTSFQIADADFVAANVAKGSYTWGTGTTKGNLPEAIEENPNVFAADTLEELAELMGVPAENLAASVDAYNAIAQGADDPVFLTSPDIVIPVRTPPFYAAKTRPSAYCTTGGLCSNAAFQLLGQDLTPVEGLYVVGADNGSLYYRDYAMAVLASLEQSFCATGGRLAAEDAVARYL